MDTHRVRRQRKRLDVQQSAYVDDAAGGSVVIATDGQRVEGIFVASKGIFMYPDGPPMEFPEVDVVYEWPALVDFLWEP